MVDAAVAGGYGSFYSLALISFADDDDVKHHDLHPEAF